MRLVPVGRSHSAIVDDDDFELISQFKWRLTTKGYATRSSGGRTQQMHRFITNAPPGVQVDHINANPLDNRKENLRFVTNQQNAWAARRRVVAKSGYRGVYAFHNRWRAAIMVDGHYVHLGYTYTPEAAAELYKNAAHEYFGTYAGV